MPLDQNTHFSLLVLFEREYHAYSFQQVLLPEDYKANYCEFIRQSKQEQNVCKNTKTYQAHTARSTVR